MRHKLAGNVDVDNLNVEVRVEADGTVAYLCQPLIYKEVVGGGCQYEVVEYVRKGDECYNHAAE